MTTGAGVSTTWYARDRGLFAAESGRVKNSTIEFSSDGISWSEIAPGGTIVAGACVVAAAAGDVVLGVVCTTTGQAFAVRSAAGAVTYYDTLTNAVVAAANVVVCRETLGAARIAAAAVWNGVANMRSLTATAQTGTFDVSFNAGATYVSGFKGTRSWGEGDDRVINNSANIRVRAGAGSDVDIIWEV